MGPLKQDEEAERRRMERRGRNGNGRTDIEAQKKEAQLRKAVLGLVSRGMVGKARRLATSHGLADMSDPLVKAAVLQKYPARTQAMPDSVLAGTCMETISCLRETFSNLRPGVSGGFGGLRNEHLSELLPKTGMKGRRVAWRSSPSAISTASFHLGGTRHGGQ